MDILTGEQPFDLNILLWITGTAFSLGVFAVKVGLGLGYGGIKWKGVFLTFSLYLLLFVLIATLSQGLITILGPVLKKGVYLHTLTASGMILWGIYTLRGFSKECAHDKYSKGALLLILPCPVCITAMAFSTWAALNVIELPPPFVGLGLGILFVTLSLLFLWATRLKKPANSQINLGLSMIGIGFYFIASLFLSSKIEEAKGMYGSFLTEGSSISISNTAGTLALVFTAVLIGCFINKKKEVNR